MSKSNIEWTEATWNPIVGCSIVSPGCTNCYAMKMAARTEAMGISRYDGTTRTVNGHAVWTGKLARAPEATLLQPLKRKKPTTYFVNSMGDLFHEDVPDEWIDQVFAVMALCPQHTFQVLTKRAKRMRDYMTKPHRPGQFITVLDDGTRIDTPSANIRVHSAMCDLMRLSPARALNEACEWQDKHYPGGDGFMRRWPLPNVWLGVSTERQKEYDERSECLRNTPAAVRFFSMEPLLGEIVADYLGDWVIAGGESGPEARPMHPDWVRFIRDRCRDEKVPFFFKQWGNWHPEIDRDNDDPGWLQPYVNYREPHFQILNLAGGRGFHGDRVHVMRSCSKKSAGRHLDGTIHDAMPEHRP